MINEIKSLNDLPPGCKGCAEAPHCHIMKAYCHKCICINCLVKPMCSDPCKEFDKRYEKMV